MTKLQKTKKYNWGIIKLFYDNSPEYGEKGWFVIFDYEMSYKNEPLPFFKLPSEIQDLILEKVKVKLEDLQEIEHG